MRYQISRFTSIGVFSSAMLVGSLPSLSAERTSASANGVAARAGSSVVTYDDLDRVALARDVGQFRGLRLREAIYEARRLALDALVEDRLLDIEAQRAGVSRTGLLDREMAARPTAITDEDVRKWYDAHQDRLKGASFDKAAPDVRRFLENQQRQEARRALLTRIKVSTPVTVFLEPPRERLAVADDEPALGPRTAPVELVMYSDFQCPYCAKVETTIAKLQQTYGERIRVVFRDFPLKAIHPHAVAAAVAARCAHEQGRFWEYHDRLFANQTGINQTRLEDYAAAVGLDMTRFAKCRSNPRVESMVNESLAAGERLGITGTPAVFINGRFVSGAQAYTVYERMIDEDLKLGQATHGRSSELP